MQAVAMRGAAVCSVFLIQLPGEGLGKLCSVTQLAQPQQ
jgi:hypothetical protein